MQLGSGAGVGLNNGNVADRPTEDSESRATLQNQSLKGSQNTNESLMASQEKKTIYKSKYELCIHFISSILSREM